MNIINILRTGFFRTAKSWKGILLIWVIYLILAEFLSVPLSAALKRSFGNSMITEELIDGLNIEAFAEIGSNLNTILSFLFPGLFFVLLTGFVLAAFLNGGLFGSFRKEAGKFSISDFLSYGAENFWSFLLIAIIIRMIIFIMSIVFIGVPVIFLLQESGLSGNASLIILLITSSLYFIMLPVLMLVADYARVARSVNTDWSGFKALGFGFSKAFDRFGKSYITMVILSFIQIIFLLLVINVIPYWKPHNSRGVFLMFLISQVLIFISLVLKAWRYASVTVSGEPYYRRTVSEPEIPDIV